MPLYREEEAVGALGGLDRLDCAVVRSRRNDKSGGDVLDRLMVEGIRLDIVRFGKLAKQSSLRYLRRAEVDRAAFVLTVSLTVFVFLLGVVAVILTVSALSAVTTPELSTFSTFASGGTRPS